MSNRVLFSLTSAPAAVKLREELHSLLSKGAIWQLTPHQKRLGLLLEVISGEKEGGGGIRPILDLQGLNSHLKIQISDVDERGAVAHGSRGGLVDQRRSLRRLFPHSHLSTSQEIPALRVQGGSGQLHSSPFWNVLEPQGFLLNAPKRPLLR